MWRGSCVQEVWRAGSGEQRNGENLQPRSERHGWMQRYCSRRKKTLTEQQHGDTERKAMESDKADVALVIDAQPYSWQSACSRCKDGAWARRE